MLRRLAFSLRLLLLLLLLLMKPKKIRLKIQNFEARQTIQSELEVIYVFFWPTRREFNCFLSYRQPLFLYLQSTFPTALNRAIRTSLNPQTP